MYRYTRHFSGTNKKWNSNIIYHSFSNQIFVVTKNIYFGFFSELNTHSHKTAVTNIVKN